MAEKPIDAAKEQQPDPDKIADLPAKQATPEEADKTRGGRRHGTQTEDEVSIDQF